MVAVAVLFGAAACGGGSDSASSTTAADGGASGSSGSAAVDAYCKRVDELAQLVEQKGADAAKEVQQISEELKTLSTAAAKDLPSNPAASKQFGACSMDASKRIAESLKPG